MLRFYTAGESHGQALVAFISGLPAGLRVDLDYINRDLKRRQGGYGRGGRMKIVAAVTEAVRKILTCLGLPPRAPPVAPAREREQAEMQFEG